MDDLFEQLKAAPPVNKNVNFVSKSGKKMKPQSHDNNSTSRPSNRRESMPSTSSLIRAKVSQVKKSRSVSPPVLSTLPNQIRPLKVLVSRNKMICGTPIKDVVKSATTVKHNFRPKEKIALPDSMKSSRNSQLLTAKITPTKAQKKEFNASLISNEMPKSGSGNKQNQVNKTIATKRCVVRLQRNDLKKLQFKLKKDLTEKQSPVTKKLMGPLKRKSGVGEKSLVSTNSGLPKTPIAESDRGSKSPICKQTPVSLPDAKRKRSPTTSEKAEKAEKADESKSATPKQRRLSTTQNSLSATKGRTSKSPPSPRALLSKSSKGSRLSSSPPTKNRSSNSPNKEQKGFYIKISPAPSSLSRRQKPSELGKRKIDKNQTKKSNKLQNKSKAVASIGHNMKTSSPRRNKPIKFTRTQLIQIFGKRFLQCHVKIERCKHPIMTIFNSKAISKVQAKHNKNKNLSVSFREQVEIFGCTDSEDDGDAEEYTPDECLFKKHAVESQSTPNKVAAADAAENVTQLSTIVTPTILKKADNGVNIDDSVPYPTQFILPNSPNDSMKFSGVISTPLPLPSPSHKKREKKSFSPLKGDSISPRKEEFKLANEKLPPTGLRRLSIDDIDDDDDCEYIVPTNLPQRCPSRDSSCASFVSATDDPGTATVAKDASIVTNKNDNVDIADLPAAANKVNDDCAEADVVKDNSDFPLLPKSPSIEESPTAGEEAEVLENTCAAIVAEEKLDLDEAKNGETAITINNTNTASSTVANDKNESLIVNASSCEDSSLDVRGEHEDTVELNDGANECASTERADDITAKDLELPSLGVTADEAMVPERIPDISPDDFELPPLHSNGNLMRESIYDTSSNTIDLSALKPQDGNTEVPEKEVENIAQTEIIKTGLV